MLDWTDPEQVAREAERRLALREQGMPLTAELTEERERRERKERERDRRLEKEIQNEVRKRFLAFGGVVYWLSQARRTGQTPGLPDLWVMFPRSGKALWFEAKTPDGRLSSAQKDFREHCLASGTQHVTGGVREAEEWLIIHGLAVRAASGHLVHPHQG